MNDFGFGCHVCSTQLEPKVPYYALYYLFAAFFFKQKQIHLWSSSLNHPFYYSKASSSQPHQLFFGAYPYGGTLRVAEACSVVL
jgi:hypothetical protein